MHCRYSPAVTCLSPVFFLPCTNVSFLDCKSNMWLFSTENLEDRKGHTKPRHVETRASHSPLCPVESRVRLPLYFSAVSWVACHRLLCLLTRPLCSWHGNVEYPPMTWLPLGGRTWGVLFIHFFSFGFAPSGFPQKMTYCVCTQMVDCKHGHLPEWTGSPTRELAAGGRSGGPRGLTKSCLCVKLFTGA